MSDKTYEDGLIAGQIAAQGDKLDKHEERLDSHSSRIRILERVAWSMFGIIGFIQILPILQNLTSQ